MKNLLPFLVIGLLPQWGFSGALAEDYRQLVLKIRPQGRFQIAVPFGDSKTIEYRIQWAEPLYPEPAIYELPWDGKTYREFTDRILLTDESFLRMGPVGSETIPLTCIFVEGRDFRGTPKPNPKFPDVILKVTLVAKDYTCTGPFNPAFPAQGGKPELWDTYVKFEVRDPTLMVPQEINLRYLWNEFPAQLLDGGSP